MTSPNQPVRPVRPTVAWSNVVLLGLVLPAIAIVVVARPDETAVSKLVLPTIFALSLMSAGMISAAVTGRFWLGFGVSLIALSTLILFAIAIGKTTAGEPLILGSAIVLAGLSFAARGALFARSAEPRGWWVALGVIAGEAAVVVSAVIDPGIWPGWLLALLPAQWATMAMDGALAGTATLPALTALGGTAAATLVVVHLWPRRWTYGIMFSVWLGLSAYVYHAAF